MVNREIKSRIREKRKALGYTQERMARELKISVNSYRQIESGSTLLISPRVEEIATLFGIDPVELISGPVEVRPDPVILEEVENRYKEIIKRKESDFKILLIEKEAAIESLKLAVESKESIIGVLKENLQAYKE
ncbi:MAG: helix-turn-helix domain-containing protein [Bacteroidales bacterium]|nr:helix-turn-helix domain-containing protein [Bacteroidales bacterium]MDD2425685.1 helix-turn-helix domain-containing protein [Bacteroidales bacterium]MDD3989706.1 helix-turn-helix domain-containing protein [Bacteroidales bacterium]